MYAKECIEKAIQRLSDRHGGQSAAASWLLDRVRRFASSERVRRCLALVRTGESPNFIPHPSTWMNHGSYNDDDREWGYRPSPAAEPHRGSATPGRSRRVEYVVGVLRMILACEDFSPCVKRMRAGYECNTLTSGEKCDLQIAALMKQIEEVK